MRSLAIGMMVLTVGCGGTTEAGSTTRNDSDFVENRTNKEGCEQPQPPPAGKRIFTTEATFDGDLGGLAGADEKCQTAADAEALGGTWKAWISDSTSNAYDRILGDGPWFAWRTWPYESTGWVLAFRDRAQLRGIPSAFLDGTERHFNLGGEGPVWTGTRIGGARGDAPVCGDWKNDDAVEVGTIGWVNVNPLVYWTDSENDASCATRAHLICFEQ
jgi:hypothetical protein